MSSKKTKTENLDADVDPAPDTSRYAEFRERALSVTKSGSRRSVVSNEPFVLGEEYGFDPAITLPKPSLKVRMLIQDAMTEGRLLDVLRYVFGSDVNRFLDTIDEYEVETGEDAELVMSGVVFAYIEHFFGKGSLTKAFTNLSI